MLLAASCYFYMAFVPIYILILGFTIVIDYYAGIFIENASGSKRKLFLTISLIANIGVLAIFKYYNFLNDNFSFLMQGFGLENPIPYLSILLPVGLSFHTFQAMSYTIEVYRGHEKAERHFGIYALYVMFYPQLVAGPIERPQNLLYQFRQKFDFDYARVTSGLRLMLWGLFKKVVIADRLAVAVDLVYNNPQDHSNSSLILATFYFAFQIFCDFSGYSDMAIGAARVMGFNLMNNFNGPYLAKSVQEFWSRWHISLSTWFKDYLYIPLGGNRVGIPRWYLNTFIVFLVSGLWHGASWNFVIWGALHGFYIVFANLTAKPRAAINKALLIDKLPILKTFTTFVLVAFAWIFFRANTLNDAYTLISNLESFGKMPFLGGINQFGHCILAIVLLFSIEYFMEFKPNFKLMNNPKPLVRWTSITVLLFIILTLYVYESFKSTQYIANIFICPIDNFIWAIGVFKFFAHSFN